MDSIDFIDKLEHIEGIIGHDYINEEDKRLVMLFISSTKRKKYILGINKFTKLIQKYIQVEGIIDDFTRVQSSRKKDILQIEQVPKDALILWTASGSPLSVKHRLSSMGFEHFSYLALCKYSTLPLLLPPFMQDFEKDFLAHKKEYKDIYHTLADTQSKEIFIKLINFKYSFDYRFMEGFTNNHEEQYFDKTLIPSIPQITFLDGGGYVGDTLPQIIVHFPDFKKIYCIEPNTLHIGIAKRDFGHRNNIAFIECGLSDTNTLKTPQTPQNLKTNCQHDYHAMYTKTIDTIVQEKVDFIKLDIEGAEQAALEGARETIAKNSPILAICIYHKAEDWYKVPQKVLEIQPHYKIYLRHYMEGIYETVMYFIPYKP